MFYLLISSIFYINISYDMINLEDYIQLQETENLLFEDDMIHILVGTDLNDFDYKRLYNENYKNILYNDIIAETLSKTYDFSKFKQELNKFKNIDIVVDYNYKQLDIQNNNRLRLQANKGEFDKKDFVSLLDKYGYKISKKITVQDKDIIAVEPIYLSDKSNEINKMKYLYHIISFNKNDDINDAKYFTLENIKKSLQKKGGIKPGRRERLSNHFRRVYMWQENANIEDMWGFIQKSDLKDKGFFVVFDLKNYLKQLNREIEWFEDPNANKAIWTRELIPYRYLKIFEIHSKEDITNIFNEIKQN